MEQVLQIAMANAKTTAAEHYNEIKEAIEFASLSLKKKYGVDIYDIRAVGQHIIVNVTLPDELADEFNFYHLRGVSAYLMKHYKNKYEPLIVAKKLFIYTIIPPATYGYDETKLSINEALELVSDFCKLLKRSDPQAVEKIKKIKSILKGEE